jgi:hypothetical protein
VSERESERARERERESVCERERECAHARARAYAYVVSCSAPTHCSTLVAGEGICYECTCPFRFLRGRKRGGK